MTQEPSVLYTMLTYVGSFLTAVLVVFNTYAAGIVAMATVFTAIVNWRHQCKRTRDLKNQN